MSLILARLSRPYGMIGSLGARQAGSKVLVNSQIVARLSRSYGMILVGI